MTLYVNAFWEKTEMEHVLKCPIVPLNTYLLHVKIKTHHVYILEASIGAYFESLVKYVLCKKKYNI